MTPETKEEIRKIWLAHKDELSLKEIYLKHLGNFFDVASWTSNHPDWLLFIKMSGEFNKELRTQEIERELETITDEEVLEVQDKNRKRAILMLREVLNAYEKNPNKFKKINISEVRNWYKTIQSIEETIKRTYLQKSKLKLDVAKSFILPYRRLSLEELKELKEKINAGIDEVIRIKTGGGFDGDRPALDRGRGK